MDEKEVVPVNGVSVDFFSAFDTKDGANAGFEAEIMRADGESSGLFITVLGQDSDAFVRLKEKQDRQRIKMVSRIGQGAMRGLYDETKQNDLELTVACTVSWRHVSGQALPFAIGPGEPEQSKAWYLKYPLAYEQVRLAMIDRTNFTPASAKN